MGAETTGERPFEELLEELEQVVSRLEQGNLPLAEALSSFERGMGLAQEADRRLGDAEERVEALVRGASGEDEAVPFEQAYPDVDLSPAGTRQPAASPSEPDEC